MPHLAFAFLLAAAAATQLAAQTADETNLRDIVRTFADTRNAAGPAKGAKIASLYTENGQWISAGGSSVVKGRPALAELWGRLTGRVDRKVESVAFPAPNIALVRVATLYHAPGIGRHAEVLVFAKSGSRWLIELHQTLDQ